MSRAERLLQLMQVLRAHRHAVSGAALAAELDISLRTLYRDIASLRAQGARIDGEAGVGYVLRAGFTLPPLMFTPEEIEALAFGARWVAARGDAGLNEGAQQALAKIGAVLPAGLRLELDTSALLVGPSTGAAEFADAEAMALLRTAIRNESKIDIEYTDLKNRLTRRTVWPFALGYFEQVRILVGWCELRQGFRHFRVDRIARPALTSECYPRRRQALLREWRQEQGIEES